MQVHANVSALFAVSVVSLVGDGKSMNFWTGRWLQGKNIQDLAPALRAAVPNAIAKKRSVQEALEGLKWVDDIRSSLQAQALLEFLLVWDILQEVQLNPDVPDHHCWTSSNSGTYSAKSAYGRFCMGAIQFEPAGRIWKSWAPPRCNFFLWLASLNRCWTADHLVRKGLDHPRHCSFCDQEEETIQHILVGCVFSKEVWFRVLSMAGLQRCTLTSGAQNFQEWWQAAERMVPKQMRDGLNLLISLMLWHLWKHCNACVFDRISPSVPRIILDINSEAALWCMADAKGY
jgi:hypothetical protein